MKGSDVQSGYNELMKKVLITGVNRGIGLALARKFHESGCLVVPTYRQKITAQILFSFPGSKPQNWFPKKYDTRKPETLRNLISFLDEDINSLDLLINNAGMNSKTSGYPKN